MATHILNHPLFKWMLGPVEQIVREKGLQQAAQYIMKRSRSTVTIQGKTTEITELIRKKPVVIVANHPSSPAVIALISALENRPDIRLIISSKFVGNSPILDVYLLPAFIQHHFTSKRNLILDAVFGKYSHGLTPEQEHSKNRQTIAQAARHLNSGGAVVLFPGYPEHDGSNWYSGVGHLLTQANRHDAVILVANIHEHSWIDYARLIPGIGVILPHIRITFAPPLFFTNLATGEPKTITKQIESHYRTLASLP